MELGGAAQAVTPPRRPGSVRRTTTHDCIRPEGLGGPVHVRSRGRDLLTRTDGTTTTLAQAVVEAEIGFADGVIATISTTPTLPALDQLVGTTAFSGFRRAAGRLVPEERAGHSIGFQLLDDLPIALMLSGRVPRSEGISLGRPGRRPPIDLCAGWVEGGTLVEGFTDLGPPLHLGPVAGPVERADDPLAWHDHDPVPPSSTSRNRRLDVWPEGGRSRVEAWFRDSHTDRAGTETVVHEYTVRADVDLRSQHVVAATAMAGTLPAPECVNAAASVERLVGTPVHDLRDRVSAALTGPTTCTHLNDALRSLEDVGALLDALTGMIDP